MLFHMPGLWRFEVLVFGGDGPAILTHDLNVE